MGHTNPAKLAVGIFVGGASKRMGGRPKGLLTAPRETAQEAERTLVERLVGQCTLALGDARIVLVGQRPEYAALALPTLPDARPEQGPLGGLVALLEHAEECGLDAVLCLACDLPYVQAPLIARLAAEAPESAACAPRTDGLWQPLCARYGVQALPEARAALDAGRLSLQKLLTALSAHQLALDEAETQSLRDWDSPEDLER